MESTTLYIAIEDDNEEEVINLINAGEEDVKSRNAEGQTYLHLACQDNVSKDIIAFLLTKIDGSIRDINGNTFADVLTKCGRGEEAKELVREFVLHILEEAITEEDGEQEDERRRALDNLHTLLLKGWDRWDDIDVDDKSEEIADFFAKLGEIQSKVVGIHEAIREGRTRSLKSLLDRADLVKAADRSGLLPLHKAIVYHREEIVDYMLEQFEECVNLTDNVGKTALHYAAGCSDPDLMYQRLMDAGADDTIQDMVGKTAMDYEEDATDVLASTIIERLVRILGNTVDSAQSSTVSALARLSHRGLQQSSKDLMTWELMHMRQKKMPVNMYISAEVYERKDVPPPSTIDGKYIANNLGTALTQALAEIAERRPWDPIEYLAHCLYKYRENVNHTKRQVQLLREIRIEEAAKDELEKRRAQRREEMRKIAEAEELRRLQEEEDERLRLVEEEKQRLAEEALQQSLLNAMVAEQDEEYSFKDRDEYGQTELHKLAAQHGTDLIAVLNMGYSLADRDVENRTPRDVAEQRGILENMESLDSYVTNLLEQESMDILQSLVLDGYDNLTDVIAMVSTEGLPDIVTDFVKSIAGLKEKIANVFVAIKGGSLRDVLQAIDRKKLAVVKDKYGRSPLHIAVLLQYKDIVNHLITYFPITVKCRDNLNRTPLHYAMAVSKEMADILLAHRANPEAKDVKQQLPSYYEEEPTDILLLQDTLDMHLIQVKGQDSPRSTTDKPAEDPDKQAEDTDKQAEDTEKTSEDTEKPSDDTEKPSDDADKQD